ncbi:hypothetical protein McpSp1_17380 [Methanocorpusculaceae archaeon Sp1]|nr:hypothetical protein [Methanocorpusculaceae archaeon Sp1]
MSVEKKISIFIDTNVLETHNSNGLTKYDSFRLPKDCVSIMDFVRDYNLQKQVEICIPEIVWREILQHMRLGFLSRKQSLTDLVTDHQKTFGKLITINCKFLVGSEEEYNNYIIQMSDDFWKNDGINCKLVSNPTGDDTLEKLLSKVFNKEKPFVEAKAIKGGKTHSDAGLKDALIIETIICYCDENNTEGILFSKDQDFNGISENLKVLNEDNKIIDYLKSKFGIDKIWEIRTIFENDMYHIESLMELTGNELNAFRKYSIEEIQETEDADIFRVNIRVNINGVIYHFDAKYDLNANQILDVSSIRDSE